MNYAEEAVIKILGKTSLLISNLDQLKLRDVLEDVLSKYSITTLETSLIASDIQEKLQMFLAVKKLEGLSNLTLKSYKRELQKFSEVLIKPVSTITTMDIRLYLACISKGKKETTVAAKISTLKSFFSWLTQEEFIQKDPTKRIKTPKTGKRLRKSLTLEELELLRNACKTFREKALLEILYSTGCRLSEIKNIKIKDINWQELSINVIGKGNKQRKVFFNIKCKIYLKDYLKDRSDNCPYLFVTSKRPHLQLGARSIQLEIAKIATRGGFDKSIFPHLLRHTFSTIALKNNMPITVIQRLLGHTSIDTTLIYAELDDSTLKQEYKKLS